MLGARRELASAENVPMVRTLYGDEAIPSQARRDSPDLEALCLHPIGVCESPRVPA
jgi:hypothetical protein